MLVISSRLYNCYNYFQVDIYAGGIFLKKAIGINIYASSAVLLAFTAVYTLLGTRLLFFVYLSYPLYKIGTMSILVLLRYHLNLTVPKLVPRAISEKGPGNKAVPILSDDLILFLLFYHSIFVSILSNDFHHNIHHLLTIVHYFSYCMSWIFHL